MGSLAYPVGGRQRFSEDSPCTGSTGITRELVRTVDCRALHQISETTDQGGGAQLPVVYSPPGDYDPNVWEPLD